MSKKARETFIKEISSQEFEEGYFSGLNACVHRKYNAQACMTNIHEREWTINQKQAQDYVSGWKYATQQ